MTPMRLKEIVDKLAEVLKFVGRAPADGCRMSCSCNRKDCLSFYLSSGDEIYTISYAHVEELSKLLKELEDAKNQSSTK